MLVLSEEPATGTTEQELEARSLVATKRDIRGGSTFNRQVEGDVSATLNTELEHTDGLSFIGLNPSILEPLARDTAANTAHAGITLNGQTKSQWHWNVTGNADYADTLTKTDQSNLSLPNDRANTTTETGNLVGNINGKLLKLPGGNVSTTLTVGGTTEHLTSDARRSNELSGSDLSQNHRPRRKSISTFRSRTRGMISLLSVTSPSTAMPKSISCRTSER